MDLASIRRANLKRISQTRFDDTLADLARAIERDDAYVWQLINGTRNMGERITRHIERKLELEIGALDSPVADANVARSPESPSYGAMKVPVVGTAQLGDDGYYDELQFPVGHGDGFVSYPTRDANAYALRVKGDSMRPRIKPGEFVIVEPNTQPQPGEEVLVKTRDGRSMVKVLDFKRGGTVQLSSINEDHKPISIEEAEIERLHYVAAIVKAALYYRTLS